MSFSFTNAYLIAFKVTKGCLVEMVLPVVVLSALNIAHSINALKSNRINRRLEGGRVSFFSSFFFSVRFTFREGVHACASVSVSLSVVLCLIGSDRKNHGRKVQITACEHP